MKNSPLSLFFFILTITLASCASKKTLKKPIFETTTYKGEKGEKEVTAINKNRADREKDHFSALEKADAAKRLIEAEQDAMNEIDTTERVGEIEDALKKVYQRTQNIINELNEVSPYSINGHKKTLELAAELNDLMQNYIEPLKKMIEANKEVKKIGGDISFNVGSAVLNQNGEKEISKICRKTVKKLETSRLKSFSITSRESLRSFLDWGALNFVTGVCKILLIMPLLNASTTFLSLAEKSGPIRLKAF